MRESSKSTTECGLSSPCFSLRPYALFGAGGSGDGDAASGLTDSGSGKLVAVISDNVKRGAVQIRVAMGRGCQAARRRGM